MMRLNRHKDYAEILGAGRKLYAQGGHVFLPNGEEFVEDSARVEEVSAAVVLPVPDMPGPAPEPLLTQSGQPAKVDPDDMRLASNKALKTQMEAFGEEWKGVAHARKFLGVG